MKTKEWMAFISLGLAWGSSFLWIKIALEELGPFTLVAFRLGFGLLGLIAVVLYNRPAFPKQKRSWGILAMIGLTNVTLPFILITWGEVHIDSAVASILNSTVPLFTAVFAHFWLAEDRLSLKRLGGLALGFVGVMVLLGLSFENEGDFQMNLLGQGAVLLAAVLYAGSAIMMRKNIMSSTPMVQSFLQVMFASAFVWPTALVVETPFLMPQSPLVWGALVWLGIIGSCIAYLLYFYLLREVGPTRATMVTYLLPVVGVLLGWLFLDENLSWNLVLGVGLILGSMVIVNKK